MLSQRNKDILKAVVESYINTAAPVGSRYVAKKYDFDLSSASIRNIMADLEDMGYLRQPHTSAGRVPTDLGFRFYVDSLDFVQKSVENKRIMNLLNSRFTKVSDDINSLLGELVSMFSDMASCVVFAIPLRAHSATLNRIQLYRYKGTRTVAVLLTNEGLVTNRTINKDFGLTQKDLDRLSDFINSEYSGFTIEAIRQDIPRRLSGENIFYDVLVSKAVEICLEALDHASGDIILNGVPELIGLPEFSGSFDRIARAMENRRRIVRLLDRLSTHSGVSVVIGRENPEHDLHDLSIVTADYGQRNKPLGSVGMIGPKRMDYARTIPMVEVMARFISTNMETEI